MGNCCGKSSTSSPPADNFAGPGRVLGSSAPPPPDRASVPANVAAAAPAARPAGDDGARAAAARAAEARMQRSNTGTGKLERDLIAQKKMTQNQNLQAAAQENRQHRDADAAAEARTWD